jgi:hypothetical protein
MTWAFATRCSSTSAGLIAGSGLGLLDLHVGNEDVERLAEITLTLVLFADGSRCARRATSSSSRCGCSGSACR